LHNQSLQTFAGIHRVAWTLHTCNRMTIQNHKRKNDKDSACDLEQGQIAKKAPPVHVSNSYTTLISTQLCSQTQSIAEFLQLNLEHLAEKTRLNLSVSSVTMSGQKIKTDMHSTTLMNDTVEIQYTDGKPFDFWDKVAQDLSTLKTSHADLLQSHALLQQSHGVLQQSHGVLQQSHAVLQTKMESWQPEIGSTRELLRYRCIDIANEILLLASKGGDRSTPNKAAFEALASKHTHLINSHSRYNLTSFVDEALKLNRERNSRLHPEQWSVLKEQVNSAVNIYLKSKKVRKKNSFAVFLLQNAEQLVPLEHRVIQ
jgi:hypothetical protein